MPAPQKRTVGQRETTRRALVSGLWLVGLLVSVRVLAQPAAEPRPCELSVWGCADARAGTLSTAEMTRRLGAARRILQEHRVLSVDARAALVRELQEVIQTQPTLQEAHSALGQLHLLGGELTQAAESLVRAEQLLANHPLPGLYPSPSLEQREPLLALALAQLSAQTGDLEAAILRYRRLLAATAVRPRILYLLADALMQKGHLREAAALYEQACPVGRVRVLEPPMIDLGRACLGLWVALDRSQRGDLALVQSRLRSYDRDRQALNLRDFPTESERAYARALTEPVGCRQLAAWNTYLQLVKADTPATYLARAQAHKAQAAHLCQEVPSGLRQPKL